ncbi:MAG: hypothetical protein EAY76_01040 [Alphaproteobacteria bacterium]|nr:MAG: hypothetical protein EAY76_01040 [Alphaproteobacteria bacterium]TAF76968.1 MAG: hypothetical protein EAZ52_02280 [Alphaproteobacteria bacterium]
MKFIPTTLRTHTLGKHTLSSFLRADEGAILPFIGITLVTMLIIAGLAIDMGRVYLVRYKTLAALDAALLGAADVATPKKWRDNPEEIRTRARQFFRANFPDNYLNTTVRDEDININYDQVTGQTTGTITLNIPLIFSGIYRLGGMNTGTTIEAPLESQVQRSAGAALEMAIALDYSFSMCFKENTGRAWGNKFVVDESCPKFRNVDRSVRKLVETIQNSVGSATVNNALQARFSIIPFTHTVNINGNNANQLYCYPDNIGKLPIARGLTANEDLIAQYLNAAFPTGSRVLPDEGGTNSAMGFWWAWSALRPDSVNRFVGASAHEGGYVPGDEEDVEEVRVQKAILLLTDGLNEYPNFRCPENGNTDDIALTTSNDAFHPDIRANARLAQMAQQAKGEGIRVILVAFNVPPQSEISQILRSAASPNSYFLAEDADQLEAAFEEIARQLVDLSITK